MASKVCPILLQILILISCVLCKEYASNRVVSLQHNPGCDIPQCELRNKSSVHIIYAKAQGSNDSLHYILSTVKSSPPTILLLRSQDPTVILKINWTQLLFSTQKNITGAVTLVSKDGKKDVKVDVENVLIFDRLLEYNDSDDTANMNDNVAFSPIALGDMEWNASMSSSPLSLFLEGSSTKYPGTFDVNSSVSLTFTPFDSVGQPPNLPSLQHNSNSSDWEFNLKDLLSRGNGSRFSVELLMLGPKQNILKSRMKSIDDEYCPAVFTAEKMEWLSQENLSLVKQSFVQWRAVSYTQQPHHRKYSTDVKTSDLGVYQTTTQYKQDILENHLLLAYFGPSRLRTLQTLSFNVSFGQPQDGFYAATKYLSWTSSIGFSSPPVDKFSTLIICIILAGVGCPILVILAGGIYMTYRRLSQAKTSSIQNIVKTNYDYQPIQ